MDLTILVLFVTLFGFIALGLPIAFAILLSALSTALYVGLTPIFIIQRLFALFEIFPLYAILLFILMGTVLSKGGATRIIVDFVECVVGRIAGGIGVVAVWSSAGFGALTGSALGTIAAIGSVMVPEMSDRGYNRPFAAALIAAAGALGQMIPPSILAIVYAVVCDVSIGKLFAALIVPGLFLTCALSAMVHLIGRKKALAGITQEYSMRQRFHLMLKAAPAGVLPLSIVGGLYGGIFTATEAGAIGVVVAIILSVTIYRNKARPFLVILKESIVEASVTTSVVLLIAGASVAWSYFLSLEEIPKIIATKLVELTSNPTLIVLLFIVLILILGTFMDGTAIVIILGSIWVSVLGPYNVDMIYFGVLVVLAALIGGITPPVAMALYVACGIGKVEFGEICREIVPFILVEVAVLIVVLFFPQLVVH